MTDAVATATMTATLGWAGRHNKVKEQVKKSCKTLRMSKCQKNHRTTKQYGKKIKQIKFQSHSLWVFTKHIGINHRHIFSPKPFAHFPKTKAKAVRDHYLPLHPLNTVPEKTKGRLPNSDTSQHGNKFQPEKDAKTGALDHTRDKKHNEK